MSGPLDCLGLCSQGNFFWGGEILSLFDSSGGYIIFSCSCVPLQPSSNLSSNVFMKTVMFTVTNFNYCGLPPFCDEFRLLEFHYESLAGSIKIIYRILVTLRQRSDLERWEILYRCTILDLNTFRTLISAFVKQGCLCVDTPEPFGSHVIWPVMLNSRSYVLQPKNVSLHWNCPLPGLPAVAADRHVHQHRGHPDPEEQRGRELQGAERNVGGWTISVGSQSPAPVSFL